MCIFPHTAHQTFQYLLHLASSFSFTRHWLLSGCCPTRTRLCRHRLSRVDFPPWLCCASQKVPHLYLYSAHLLPQMPQWLSRPVVCFICFSHLVPAVTNLTMSLICIRFTQNPNQNRLYWPHCAAKQGIPLLFVSGLATLTRTRNMCPSLLTLLPLFIHVAQPGHFFDATVVENWGRGPFQHSTIKWQFQHLQMLLVTSCYVTNNNIVDHATPLMPLCLQISEWWNKMSSLCCLGRTKVTWSAGQQSHLPKTVITWQAPFMAGLWAASTIYWHVSSNWAYVFF